MRSPLADANRLLGGRFDDGLDAETCDICGAAPCGTPVFCQCSRTDGPHRQPLEPPSAAGPEDYGLESVSAKRPTEPSPPIIRSSAQFIEGFVPPDYLLDGILQRRFVYSLTGKTGSGKTALLTFLAASVGLCRAVGPHAVETGRVLYLAGENPDDVRMRWIALSQQMDFDIDAIDVNFIPGVFKISQMMERIRNEVAVLGGVSLIIVDTSAAYFEGDQENDNKQQGDHARRFRELTTLPGGPCVVVACHPAKNASDDNLLPRGGGAFVAEMDGNTTVQKDGMVVEIHWQGKFRGPDFAPISFLLRTVTHERLKDSKGRLIPAVVAGHLSEARQTEMATAARGNENLLLEVLNDNEGASLAELARKLGWSMQNGQPNKMLVKRTLEKLQRAKLVTRDRDSWAVADKAKKTFSQDKI